MIAQTLRQLFRSFSPLSVAAALAACFLGGDTLLAKHPKNAGPTSFEIKFKLPPPPVLSPAQALEAFSIEPGFRIEVVAAEPLVEAPIAMSFDDQGRLYVCEMRGYMHDVEGTGEDQPIGRIKRLEDINGDGAMDKATIFVDQLVLPRAVTALGGGALVAEPPNLTLYRDTNDDGVADTKQVIATDFGKQKGQPEHMANTPMWALDNWIYSAMHPTRFRYGPDKWAGEEDRGRGQWGLSQDDYGRLVFNSNSDLLRADVLPNAYYERNPNLSAAAGLNLQVIKDQSVWPGRPTPGVNRGYGDELREDGSLKKATAAGGAVIYRGDLFPEGYRGNAFIPEPSGNLIKRVVVSEKDALLVGQNATPGTDFLTSTDERFRPVTAANGPDGALYLVDMYRGVLQHSGFLTHYLVANIKERQLEQPLDRGRIYRIVPEKAKPRAVKLPRAAAEIVPLLAHGNGWVRDTAQRVLVERADRSMAPELEKMASGDPNPLGRLHALWTLEGLGALTPALLTSRYADGDSKVRAAAVRLSEPLLAPATRAEVLPALLKLPEDPSADVQIQLALSLGPLPESGPSLIRLLERGAKNILISEAVLTGLRNRELGFLELLLGRTRWKSPKPEQRGVLRSLAQCIMRDARPGPVQRLLQLANAEPAGSAVRLALLDGMSSKPPGKSKPKLVRLPAEPPELAALRPNHQKLIDAIDERLTWPGKAEGPAVPPLTADEQILFNKGREVYALFCVGCHQPTGLGQEGLAPPLADSDWVDYPAERLVAVVIHGLSGLIKVSGAEYWLEMPPLPILEDEQVAAVLTYIRREWENTASPVSVDLVRRVREATEGRTAAWTAADLEKFKLSGEKQVSAGASTP